ncbi:class I SAM-dependent methyltransferase [Longispora albida]|uniref:class I SAM-dependent methyltransferase n=1 Tax=Longispora albida TaxID=203523 RepID=UPI00037DB1FC|nr:class I SAM-dependent methyltransferase [Longispora albida]
MSALTSREHNAAQYATKNNLAARQSLWSHYGGRSVFDVALDLAELSGDELVIDVGCGNGRYLENLRARGHRGLVAGLDYSAGMARAAGEHGLTGVADAQRLPVGTGKFDLALCMHMLYHVPDVDAALRELRRVVKPEGRVLVATNSLIHTQEFLDIVREAAERLDVEHVPVWSRESFTAEAAPAHLEPVFSSVTAHHQLDEVRVPDLEPVLAYVGSLNSIQGYQGTGVLELAGDLAKAKFDERGYFPVTRAMTVFVCRP